MSAESSSLKRKSSTDLQSRDPRAALSEPSTLLAEAFPGDCSTPLQQYQYVRELTKERDQLKMDVACAQTEANSRKALVEGLQRDISGLEKVVNCIAKEKEQQEAALNGQMTKKNRQLSVLQQQKDEMDQTIDNLRQRVAELEQRLQMEKSKRGKEPNQPRNHSAGLAIGQRVVRDDTILQRSLTGIYDKLDQGEREYKLRISNVMDRMIQDQLKKKFKAESEYQTAMDGMKGDRSGHQYLKAMLSNPRLQESSNKVNLQPQADSIAPASSDSDLLARLRQEDDEIEMRIQERLKPRAAGKA